MLSKLSTRFFLGSSIYMGIEVWHHKFTSRLMGVVGGVCFLIMGSLDETFPKWSVRKKAFWSANIIVLFELLVGLKWNKDYKRWDYRNLPLNYKGQICFPFWLVWLLIAPFAFWFDGTQETEDKSIGWYYKQLFRKE